MTTILGLRSGGVSYLAADSRYCAGNPIPTKAEKIVRVGRWAIGASGYARTTNVLSENVRLLATIEDIARLSRELRRLLLDDGWQKKNEDGPSTLGDMALIVADEGAAWFVGSDFSYHVLEDGRPWGTGSGAEYAEGACTAFLSAGVHPAIAMADAIGIACRYDPGTDDRAQIVRLGAERPEQKDCRHEPSYPGQDTVLTSLSVPDWTCHPACEECPFEVPHPTIGCGKWTDLGS